MLVIGLTGGIASGKSEVSRLFEELGAPVIDTDKISRELVEPGSAALQEIAVHFGDGMINSDGSLDRKQLGRIIFASQQQRERLEDILHPRIREEVNRRLKALDAPYAVVVIPLLVETRYPIAVDRILVVTAPRELQLQRLVERNGISAAEADSIIGAQATNSERLAVADEVISNSGTLDALRDEVQRLHGQYLLS